MADARIAQLPTELLSRTPTEARIAQVCVEFLTSTTETVTLGHSVLIAGQRNYAIGGSPT